jgi:hypothetical protein
MVDWMFSSPPILLEAEVTPVISKFVLDACGTSASRQRSAGQLLSMDESVKKSGVMPLERETVNSEIICE